jgi:hypothetical protein
MSKGTKLCKYCQSEIPKKAKICPNCCKKQSHAITWIIVAIVVFFVIPTMLGHNEKAENQETEIDSTIGETSNVDVNDNIDEINNEISNTNPVQEDSSTITLEFGKENEYSQTDECTNGMKYYDNSQVPKKEIYSYIDVLPTGKYSVTYGYKYPRENGLFYIEDNSIYEEDGYLEYDNIQYINANYYEGTIIEVNDNQHIRLDTSDTKFIFTKVE